MDGWEVRKGREWVDVVCFVVFDEMDGWMAGLSSVLISSCFPLQAQLVT